MAVHQSERYMTMALRTAGKRRQSPRSRPRIAARIGEAISFRPAATFITSHETSGHQSYLGRSPGVTLRYEYI
jgi:hypothetical protein